MIEKNYINIFAVILISACLIPLPAGSAIASIENNTQVQDSMDGQSLSDTVPTDYKDDWEYEFEDRPDPFKPFIEPKVATKTIPEEEVKLTGMQLFEPGQLTLVAVLAAPDGKIAMVEDVTGKGYILEEGMPIGRYGVVSQISLDQVKIKETRTVAGKDVITPIVMRLNKEGDQ